MSLIGRRRERFEEDTYTAPNTYLSWAMTLNRHLRLQRANARKPLFGGQRRRYQCAKTNETGRVYVPLVVGLNFQLSLTQRAAALANIGGPEEPSASTILPA
jgi:hypothetical protein